MSTVLRPVGPQPGRVYWVRRLVLLLALVVLAVVVAAAVSAARSGGTDDPTSPGASEEEPGAQSEASGDGAPEGGAEGAVAGDDEGAATDGGPVPCGPQDLTVTLAADARSYGPDEAATFTLTFANSGEGTCVVDAGSRSQALVVSSGADRIWSSADCPAEGGERTLLLTPGAQDSETVVWPRVRSDGACSGELPEPRPGTYTAVAVLAGAQSDTVVFEVDEEA